MLLSLILGSSPHLPVSVCGTGISIQDLQAFLVSVILDTSLLYFSLSLSVRVFPLPRLSSTPVSFMSFKYYVVQEFLPAVHRIRFSASP